MRDGDRRTQLLRALVFLGMLGLLVAPCAGKEDPAPPRFEARTFNSKLALRVFVVAELGEPTRECILGRTEVVGVTPAPTPLQIPACAIWFVEPLDQKIEDDALKGLAKEIKRQEIPGLSLAGCSVITNGGMKSLAGSRQLVFLGIAGTNISSDGMAKLKKLPALRFLDGRPGALGGLDWIKKFTALELVDLSGHRILQGPELKALRGLKQLHELRLASVNMLGDRGMKEVLELKRLRVLDLGFCRSLTAAGVKILSEHPTLESLCVDGIQITDETLADLKALPLVALRIRGTRGVTDEGMSSVAAMGGLRHLDLRGCYSLTDAGLARISGLADLEVLRLMATKGITDATLSIAAGLKQLRTLEISHMQLTDTGLAHLAGHERLESLYLRATGVSDRGFVHLAKCPRLRSLVLSACEGVTDPGLEDLASLPLVVLDLGETTVSDEGLAALAGLEQLRELSLAKSEHIDGTGLGALASLASLRRLDLSDASLVADEAVPAIAKLGALRQLLIRGTAITIRGERQLQEALPACEIER